MWRGMKVLLLAAVIALAGCSDDGEDQKKDSSTVKLDGSPGDTKTTPTPDQKVTTPDTGSNKAVGDPCSGDAQCTSTICHNKKCAKTCKKPTDCAAKQDCGPRQDGKTAFCYDRKYSSEVGKSCAATYKCTDTTLKCYYTSLTTSGPYCGPTCKDNTDCPPQYFCRGTTTKICAQRKFCASCLHDAQCPPLHKCIKSGSTSFCARQCTKGSKECPRFADCKDGGSGTYYCYHKAGSCTASGKHCDPCNGPTDCTNNAMCITLNASWGYYCGQDCTSKSCPTDNKCYSVTGTSKKQCWPDPKKKKGCVTLTSSMDAGDVMDDFSMVGITDADKNGSLSNDKRRLVKLSDFAKDSKVILFVISAGWCGPCKTETKLFKGWMKTYGPKGLMIVQALTDSATKGKAADPNFLSTWISTYDAMGAIGIDPKKLSSQYNTKGTIPMNMMLDAKTRKVLVKWNGGGTTKTEGYIKQYLNIATPDAGTTTPVDAGVPQG